MFTARISFLLGAGDVARTTEFAFDLLACWHKNGQIVGDSWPMAARARSVDAYVNIPAPDALDPRHDNVYASKRLADATARGEARPTIEVVGADPGASTICGCAAPSARVLFTHYLSDAPPVRCLDCFGPVPLYRLPHVHDHEHLILLQWAADYRACDTLQMHCTTGERFGEQQLARHDGSLARQGRDLGATLERLTDVPVYYHLHRTRSRGRAAEHRRRCPACGADWRLAEPLHSFDFRCDPCRLLSAVAADAS